MGRKRHEEHEEHENHERWLVTYADMVTLLMVLFIVMFAMSQVDQKKFQALKEGLAAGFGQSTSIQTGSESILDQAGMSAQAPVAPNRFNVEVKQVKTSELNAATAAADLKRARQQRADAEAEVDRYQEIIARLGAALAKNGLSDDVMTSIDNRGLVVSLVSKHIVFEPNIATLSPRGAEIVDTLAPVLADLSDPLGIDGHTNQVKVKPKYYPTDWELSAARAVSVLRRLSERNGIPNERLTATAFGHTKPLMNPSKRGSQEINKRVDIVILSSLPSESRSLIADVAQERGAKGGLS